MEDKWDKIINDFMDLVFNLNEKRLPMNQNYKNLLATNDWIDSNNDPIFDFMFRKKYIKKSFPILSHEFLNALSTVCANYKLISELGAGIGWLTHWMRQYEINIVDCIDDMSWHQYKDQDYLKHVKKHDAVKYVYEHPEIDLFVLSWPDTLIATDVWMCMRPGQSLLYIGEPKGGCTAEDKFFDLTRDKLILSDSVFLFSFISFFGVRDRPYLFEK